MTPHSDRHSRQSTDDQETPTKARLVWTGTVIYNELVRRPLGGIQLPSQHDAFVAAAIAAVCLGPFALLRLAKDASRRDMTLYRDIGIEFKPILDDTSRDGEVRGKKGKQEKFMG
uniref:Uncharacterized protein n=1 Tax=Anopheles culicifacies TaxID=139723 RepID=A0A182MKM3_9DIPT